MVRSCAGGGFADGDCRRRSIVGASAAPLLGQLLDNLLENACKYSAAGTLITVSLLEEGGVVPLSVADTGCGIAIEDLPHVFEPFYRSAQARSQGVAGVGLGLAVAERIAHAWAACCASRASREKSAVHPSTVGSGVGDRTRLNAD